MCRFVVNEMIQSEKDYVKDLGVIVEVRLVVWFIIFKDCFDSLSVSVDDRNCSNQIKFYRPERLN